MCMEARGSSVQEIPFAASYAYSACMCCATTTYNVNQMALVFLLTTLACVASICIQLMDAWSSQDAFYMRPIPALKDAYNAYKCIAVPAESYTIAFSIIHILTASQLQV